MTKYTDDFDSFWKAWPGRYNSDTMTHEKVGKHQAFVIWRTMTDQDKDLVLNIVGKVKARGTRYLPDAWKWLAEKRYEDYV